MPGTPGRRGSEDGDPSNRPPSHRPPLHPNSAPRRVPGDEQSTSPNRPGSGSGSGRGSWIPSLPLSARSHGAPSPAFLSPRMWDEGDVTLPPSNEVPKRMAVVGRMRQDTGCFGLFTFTIVLFLCQSLSALIGANYQLPHEFELCQRRLVQESVAVARRIPAAEVAQVSKSTTDVDMKASTHSWLVGVDGWTVKLPPVAGSKLLPSVKDGAAAAHITRSATRRLLEDSEDVGVPRSEGTGGVPRSTDLAGGVPRREDVKGGIPRSSELAGGVPRNDGEGEKGGVAGWSALTAQLSGLVKEKATTQKTTKAPGAMATAGALINESAGALGFAGKVVEAEAVKDISTLQNQTGLSSVTLGGLAISTSTNGTANGALAAAAVTVGDGDKFDPDEAEETIEVAMKRVRGASLMVMLLAGASIAAGAIWVTLLSWFPKAFILLTVSTVPAALALLSAYFLFIIHQPVFAAAAFTLLLCAGALIYKLQARLSFTAALLACAGKALSINWSVIVISIALSCVQVVLLGACVLAIGLSFMSGEAVRVHTMHRVANPDQAGSTMVPGEICEWRTDSVAYVGMGFIIVVMLWSNGVLNEMKRFVITGTIALWYLHKVGDSETPRTPVLGKMLPPTREGSNEEAWGYEEERTEPVVMEGVPALTVLGWSLQYSFGSLCFSALVSTPIEMVKALLRPQDWEDTPAGPRGKRRPLPPDAGQRQQIWYVLQDIIGFVNSLAIPLSAVSGHPFCHCAKVTNLLMMRSRMIPLMLDPTPALILRTGAAMAACGSAIGWLFLASAYVSIEGPEMSGAMGGEEAKQWTVVERFFLFSSLGVSLLVLNFFASVLLDASDAMLLLLAIDRDNNTISPNGKALHELLESEHAGAPAPSPRVTVAANTAHNRRSGAQGGRPVSMNSQSPRGDRAARNSEDASKGWKVEEGAAATGGTTPRSREESPESPRRNPSA